LKRQNLPLLLGVVCALLLPARGEAVDDLEWRSNSHLRLGGGWYASPGEGMGLDGYQLGVAYHYAASNHVLLGPAFNYAGIKAERPLQDLPLFSDPDPALKLRIHQVRLGLKGLFSPMPREPAPQRRGARRAKATPPPFWVYGAIDTGLAIHYVSELAGQDGTSFSDTSGDWYIKPGVGVLIAPRSPLTVFVELGYTVVPTYKLRDKQFSFYGAPTPVEAQFNTDGFVLEAGVAFQF
jgi:hypothetical protein